MNALTNTRTISKKSKYSDLKCHLKFYLTSKHRCGFKVANYLQTVKENRKIEALNLSLSSHPHPGALLCADFKAGSWKPFKASRRVTLLNRSLPNSLSLSHSLTYLSLLLTVYYTKQATTGLYTRQIARCPNDQCRLFAWRELLVEKKRPRLVLGVF